MDPAEALRNVQFGNSVTVGEYVEFRRRWFAFSGVLTCQHGHPRVQPWSGAWGEECRYGHPIHGAPLIADA